MRTTVLLASAMTIAAGALAPAAALAKGWTPTRSIAVGKSYEPVPRVAIASDGTSVLAFASKTGKLMVSTGTPDGRFTTPRVVDRFAARGEARDWSVAARAGGGFIVAYEYARGIKALVRARRGAATYIARVADSSREEINGVQVAADPLGGWVVAEREFRRTPDRQYHVRTMTVDDRGRLTGPVQDLGPGHFGIDARPTVALTVDDAGRAILAFEREVAPPTPARATVVVSVRPHGGAFGAPVELGGDAAADPRVAVGTGGQAMVAATAIRSPGDAATFGNPLVAPVGPAGALGAPFGPSLAHPRRAFGPSVAFTSASRGVLVFQLKTSAQPFETRAPVRAAAFGLGGPTEALQTLEGGRAKEPVVMPLAPTGAVVLWSGARGLGAARATARGTFSRIATPKGPPPPPFHSNSTNRDLRTGGRWAIFAWSRSADGRVRVSVRRF